MDSKLPYRFTCSFVLYSRRERRMSFVFEEIREWRFDQICGGKSGYCLYWMAIVKCSMYMLSREATSTFWLLSLPKEILVRNGQVAPLQTPPLSIRPLCWVQLPRSRVVDGVIPDCSASQHRTVFSAAIWSTCSFKKSLQKWNKLKLI